MVEQSEDFRNYFEKYHAFNSEILKDSRGTTAQLYMDIIQMVLTLIRTTKENNLELYIAALYALCPMFFAYDHTNYARYVPVYLITLLNLSDTLP